MNPTSTPTRSMLRRGFLAALFGLAMAFTVAPTPSPAQTEIPEGERQRLEEHYAQGVMKMPANKSDLGKKIDMVFYWILGLTSVVFVATQAVLVWFLIRYRERKNAKQTIVYSHGSNFLEFVWTAIPALILVILAFVSEGTWNDARKTPPEDPLHIRVLGRQYQWNFYYPGADGVLGTDDDLEDPILAVPVNRPVMFHISSQDVLHSFWLPSFRIKQDAMPGANVRVWMTPLETGDFEVACAEFCGVSHGNMKAQFRVLSEEDYDAYIAEVEEFMFGYGDDDGGYE